MVVFRRISDKYSVSWHYLCVSAAQADLLCSTEAGQAQELGLDLSHWLPAVFSAVWPWVGGIVRK